MTATLARTHHGRPETNARWLRRAGLAVDAALRLAIVYWLVEAWVMQSDSRFAGKAIPVRNTLIVGTLSLLVPAIWYLRKRPWSRYPAWLDSLYLSIYALDMAGNSFDLYNGYAHFDLIPHFHGTAAFSLIAAATWASPLVRGRAASGWQWALQTTLVAAGLATMVHVGLELQEYYTDVLAGTINVRGVSDTAGDLSVGLAGALTYPLLWCWWQAATGRNAEVPLIGGSSDAGGARDTAGTADGGAP